MAQLSTLGHDNYEHFIHCLVVNGHRNDRTRFDDAEAEQEILGGISRHWHFSASHGFSQFSLSQRAAGFFSGYFYADLRIVA